MGGGVAVGRGGRPTRPSSLLDSARDDVGDQEFSGVVIYAEVSCSRNDAIDLSKRKKNRSDH